MLRLKKNDKKGIKFRIRVDITQDLCYLRNRLSLTTCDPQERTVNAFRDPSLAWPKANYIFHIWRLKFINVYGDKCNFRDLLWGCCKWEVCYVNQWSRSKRNLAKEWSKHHIATKIEILPLHLIPLSLKCHSQLSNIRCRSTEDRESYLSRPWLCLSQHVSCRYSGLVIWYSGFNS